MPSLHTLNDLSLAFTGGGGTSFEKISEIILSTAGSFTFSNIPQTYSHLQICVNGGASSGVPGTMQFNGDTGTNYGWGRIRGDTATSYTEGISATYIDLGTIIASVSGMSSLDYTTIFNYTQTNLFKSVINEGTYGSGASIPQYIFTRTGQWRNTAAITQITISLGSSATYSVGTVATLYGIK